MGFQINNNVAAFNAYRNLSVTQNSVSSSLEKLSSGLRINRAADDAAGLAISEGLRSQVGGLKVAVRNAQDGISVVQTAEGALSTSTSILQRMRDLSVQAANDGGLNASAKGNIQKEFNQLSEELTRIADTTQFNGKKLLDGTYNGAFQVGANGGEQISVTITSGGTPAGLGAVGLGVATAGATPGTDPDVPLVVDAAGTLATIDAAIGKVSTARADLGAKQNRLEMTIKNLNVSVENLSASESRIRDTDMAAEMVSFTKSQILSQAGTAMLAQANQMGQGVLSLLR
ncbi:flagellin [uncultured Pseudokineococcus sp.]|uniref:flagellin N-terminal helical domain-containing protein n=1 Tax=uncultured Pseudokineococcus sp. TaxID=1642928 RepID=UPI002619ADF7|nr:flagellin [uncultured Pseudokineococcus sp.]